MQIIIRHEYDSKVQMIVVGIACWCSYFNNVDTGLDILSLSIGMCKCKRMPRSMLATSRDNMCEIRSFNCSVDADTVCCSLFGRCVVAHDRARAPGRPLSLVHARMCSAALSLSFSLDPKRDETRSSG